MYNTISKTLRPTGIKITLSSCKNNGSVYYKVHSSRKSANTPIPTYLIGAYYFTMFNDAVHKYNDMVKFENNLYMDEEKYNDYR